MLHIGHSFRGRFEFWSELKILPCFLHLFAESFLVRLLSAARFNLDPPFALFFSLSLDFDMVVPKYWLVVLAVVFGSDSQSLEVRVSSTSTGLSFKFRLVLLPEESGCLSVRISESFALDEGLKKFLIVIGGLIAFFSNRLLTGVESSIVAEFDLSVNIGTITGAIPS